MSVSADIAAELGCWAHALRKWFDQHQASGSAIAQEALARYAEYGWYPVDNKAIQNAIRPLAVGRKNWLFAESEQAGRCAAAIMSLLATAKANRLNPRAWLTDTLTCLPTTLNRNIDSLLQKADDLLLDISSLHVHPLVRWTLLSSDWAGNRGRGG